MCFKSCSVELLLKLKMHHCAVISSYVHFWPGFQRCWGCVNTAGGIRVHIFNKVLWKEAEKIKTLKNPSYPPEKYSAKSVCHKTHLLFMSSTGLLLLHQLRAWWSRSQTCSQMAIPELNKGVVVHNVFFLSSSVLNSVSENNRTIMNLRWI